MARPPTLRSGGDGGSHRPRGSWSPHQSVSCVRTHAARVVPWISSNGFIESLDLGAWRWHSPTSKSRCSSDASTIGTDWQRTQYRQLSHVGSGTSYLACSLQGAKPSSFKNVTPGLLPGGSSRRSRRGAAAQARRPSPWSRLTAALGVVPTHGSMRCRPAWRLRSISRALSGAPGYGSMGSSSSRLGPSRRSTVPP